MSGRKRHNYDVSFRKAARLLHKLPLEERKQAAETMCNDYYAEHSEFPSDYLLEIISDSLLDEQLKDDRSYKSRRYEYPFLSESQLTRRITGSNQAKDLRVIEYPLNGEELDEHFQKYRDFVYKTLRPADELAAEVAKYDAINEGMPVTVSYVEPRPSDYKRKIVEGRGDEQTVWARAVKDRDLYQCQKPSCRSRAGIMHAHHIHNYADYPELRLEVSNGVTLCEPCHTDFHRLYGKKRTNSEDLSDYFNS